MPEDGNDFNANHLNLVLVDQFDNFLDSFNNTPDLTTGDQQALSVINNTKTELNNSVYANQIQLKLMGALKQLSSINFRSNRIYKFSNGIKELLQKFNSIVEAKPEAKVSMQVRAQVKEIFAQTYTARPEGEGYQVLPVGNTGGADKVMENKIPDNRSMEKNTDPPKEPELVSNDPSADLNKSLGELHKYIDNAKSKCYSLYEQSFNYKMDTDNKITLTRNIQRLYGKIDTISDLIKDTEYLIKRSKTPNK